MRSYAFVIMILVSISSYAQTDTDYLYINKMVHKQRRMNLPFLIQGDLLSKEFHGDTYNEDKIVKQYVWSLNELFADTLTQYVGVIDEQKVLSSFVHWDKRYIKNTAFTEDIKNDFCYITKPILLDSSLFVVITFDYCALGGITACLYQYDQVQKSIKSIRLNTITLYGFDTKW